MRPWLSGITSPCQGLVGVSITPGRTKKKDPSRVFFRLWSEKGTYRVSLLGYGVVNVSITCLFPFRHIKPSLLPHLSPQSDRKRQTIQICGQLRGQVDKGH